MSSPSRAEAISRERDDIEREEYRARRLRTKAELLEEIDALVESGSLVIRTATSDERVRYGIRAAELEVDATRALGEVLAKQPKDKGGRPRDNRSPGTSGFEVLPPPTRDPTASQRAALIVAREAAVESEPVLTAAELAKEAGVSLRTVERALRVQEADAVLFQSMLAGKLSATAADKAIR